MSKRHKWDSKVGTCIDDNIAQCVNCGMLKQMIRGKVAYFKNDTSRDWAGECDGKKEENRTSEPRLTGDLM